MANFPIQIGVKALIPTPSDGEWRYLFLERAECFPGESTPRLDVPGGRVDATYRELSLGFLFEELAREIYEETRLTLSRGEQEPIPLMTQELTTIDPKDRFVRMTTIAQTAPGPIQLSDEHTSIAYLTRREARTANIDPAMRQLLAYPWLFSFEESLSPSSATLNDIRRQQEIAISQIASV